MIRIGFALSAALLACGGKGDGPSDGFFVVEEEGSGPENADTLLPLHSGSVFGPRSAVVRAPVEVEGRVVHRYITQPNTVASSVAAEAQAEAWMTRTDEGIWFEGTAHDGMLEEGIMLVPTTVRVGMRWRTGSSNVERSYEVIRRDEAETVLGPTVLWTIEQQTNPPIHRIYAEGWGLVSLAAGELTPERIRIATPLRAVSESEDPIQADGASLALRPLLDGLAEGSGLPQRVDSIRASRLDDGETRINVTGASRSFTTTLRVVAMNLSYRDGVLTEVAEAFPDGALKIRPSLPGLGANYESPTGGYFPVGNVLHRDGQIVYTTEDILLYENELGGVAAASVAAFYPSTPYRFELPLVEPHYLERPVWGTFPKRSLSLTWRNLIGSGATDATVPFAHLSGDMGSLWSAQLSTLGRGRRLTAPNFVEAFPDTMGSDLTAKRGPLIDTSTSSAGNVHLFTTPGGMIDRIVVDTEGGRRERIGRAQLPAGHVLRAAADVGDGTILVFTYDWYGQTTHIWATDATSGSPVRPAPFVSLDWTAWDARVCWPGSTEGLDGSDWRLGPAPAADVVPIGDHCALVIRDLAATPVPWSEWDGSFPVGWGVFEGTLPGVGRVRAYEPNDSLGGMVAPRGAWLSGGGAIGEFAPDPDTTVGLEFSAGGIPRGTAPNFERSRGAAADASGAGVWATIGINEEACPVPCMATAQWGIALGGPEPQFFPTMSMDALGYVPVLGGGVIAWSRLVDSTHTGAFHLRPDGSFVEITPPDRYRGTPWIVAVRESGEVCGTGEFVDASGTQTHAWCAQPDGTGLREGPIVDVVEHISSLVMLDDRTLLLDASPGSQVLLVDLQTMRSRPYPTGGVRDGNLVSGADGVVYGGFQPDEGEATLGAFTVDGFVPLSELYDVSSLYEPGVSIEPSSLLVTETFVAVVLENQTIRIPRSRWNSPACAPTTAPGLDADGDGYIAATSCGDDCNDDDENINPGATDVCGDAIDDDCDGTVNMGTTCYADADGDGYAPGGAAEMSACTCADGLTDRAPTGDDIDCTDDNADAFPGQTEYFDVDVLGGTTGSFDYDCDGADTPRWSDGAACSFGMGCVTPEGFVDATGCGQAGDFIGCADGVCSAECVFDEILVVCNPPPPITVTQACR